jgi:hypothetical protein
MENLLKTDRDIDKQGIEAIQQKQQQQEFKFVNDLKPLKGHILWEINLKTMKVKEAEYKKTDTITWSEAIKIYNGEDMHKEVIINQDCVYFSALNKKSAITRLKSNKGSAKRSNSTRSLNFF